MIIAQVETWGDKLRNGFEGFFDFIPNLAAFLAILIIGYLVAKLVAAALGRVLERVGLDRTVGSGRSGEWISRATSSPSRLLGGVAFWALFLGAISLAVSVLGIEALTDFVAAVYSYLPNVIAALLIFLVAAAIAAAVGGLVPVGNYRVSLLEFTPTLVTPGAEWG